IEISGDSRGYIHQASALLPEKVAAKMAQEERGLEARFPGFRIEREEISVFPGDWATLKGKSVKIYTIQPISQNPKESGPAIRLDYSLALFEKGLKESTLVTP